MDKRHLVRTQIVQDLFAYTYSKRSDELPHKHEISLKIIANTADIDAKIVKYAVKYPIEKISRTDLSILRLAVYELSLEHHEPEKVIVNEAVELAKELGGEKSYSFINGVLGKLITHHENTPTG